MVISLFSDYQTGLLDDVSCIMKKEEHKNRNTRFSMIVQGDSIVETAHVFLKTQISSMNLVRLT